MPESPSSPVADGDRHTPGEFVDGLGWSCTDCDTFGCAAANAEAERHGLCSRRGCGRPPSEHEMGVFCP